MLSPEDAQAAAEQDVGAQIADLTQQIADRDAHIAELGQRVRYVEGEYRKLQQANGTAANELLAANHPLA